MTALQETLWNFRPSLKWLHRFSRLGKTLAKELPRRWREENVLLSASIEINSGDLFLLDEMSFRHRLELELAELLVKLGIPRLDAFQVQSSSRELTQAIARWAYGEGAAGLLYRSKLDSGLCAALFEGRARLLPQGPSRALTKDLPELVEVCQAFDLLLR